MQFIWSIFTIYTDHKSLKSLNLQNASSRLNRWPMKLSEYGYIVDHKPGTQVRHADSLDV
jgi:type I site-specific restriction-modification system R (restriction) subunit